jgi:hypothetical protein
MTGKIILGSVTSSGDHVGIVIIRGGGGGRRGLAQPLLPVLSLVTLPVLFCCLVPFGAAQLRLPLSVQPTVLVLLCLVDLLPVVVLLNLVSSCSVVWSTQLRFVCFVLIVFGLFSGGKLNLVFFLFCCLVSLTSFLFCFVLRLDFFNGGVQLQRLLLLLLFDQPNLLLICFVLFVLLTMVQLNLAFFLFCCLVSLITSFLFVLLFGLYSGGCLVSPTSYYILSCVY